MYGDFEAQRHWMELTTTVPISDWYWHDIEWWGLDYPPLTAYHSWLCGKMSVFAIILCSLLYAHQSIITSHVIDRIYTKKVGYFEIRIKTNENCSRIAAG